MQRDQHPRRTIHYVLALLAIFCPLVFYRVWQPNSLVFDEFYYVNAARNITLYLKDPNWLHPPAGKLFIALGIKALGDNPLGWRVAPATMGVLGVLGLFFLCRTLFKSEYRGFIAALLLSFDCLYLVHSRIAMLDVFAISLGLIAFAFLLKGLTEEKRRYIYVSGLFFGLSTASKLIGLFYMLAAFFAFIIFKGPRYVVRGFKTVVLTLVAIPLAVYLLTYIPVLFIHYPSLVDAFSEWIGAQEDLLIYGATLTGKHPYASPPWTWPIMAVTIPYYWGFPREGVVSCIYGLGNPAIWFPSLAVLPVMVYEALREKDKVSLFLFTWFCSSYFVFYALKRIMYLFYMLLAVPPMCAMLAKCMSRFYIRLSPEKARKLEILCVVGAAIVFMFLYPICTAIPIPRRYVEWIAKFKIY